MKPKKIKEIQIRTELVEGEKKMNKVILIGRLTRDPEVRYSQGDNPIAIARYSLAVNRKYNSNKALFKVLEEKCKKKEMTCRPVLWSLKLKGVDDYLACKKRNVDYTTK